MTTIAFDGKTLAVDNQSTGSYIEYKNKIITVGDTVVVGTGLITDISSIIDWLNKPKNYPTVTDTNVYVFSKKNGKVIIKQYSKGPVPSIRGLSIGGFFACGSGGVFALGAMEAGASAKQAVKIAIRLDPDSGGKVETYKF